MKKHYKLNVERLMREKRFSDAVLAAATKKCPTGGLSRQTIWSLPYATRIIKTVNALCFALDCEPGDLFEAVDSK